MKKTIISLLFLITFQQFCQAQAERGNDFLSNIGKIYVVVGVMMIIFAIIVGFLIHLERKVAKLEQELK